MGWMLLLFRSGLILGLVFSGTVVRLRSFSVFSVNGVLPARALQTDFFVDFRPVDFEVAAVGLEPFGNDLKAHGISDRNYVDHRLAVLVSLQLHNSVVAITENGV